MIFCVPPFFHPREGEFVRLACIDEVRDVMHECRNLSRLLISLEVGLGSLILPERMKLGNKKASIRSEHAGRLREDEGKVRDMFEHEVADDQVE